MTVSTEVDHNDYTGNGVTTSFPYTFRIFKKSDLTVQVADLNENITVLALDTDYSVTGAGTYSGGNVVLMSPLANGWQISISRDLPVTQETDLRNQGKFFAEVHEDAFDKLTMLIQQCFSFLRLALRKPSFIANYYDALNNKIRNLHDPSQPQDAATKHYVDVQIVDNTNAWKASDAVLDQKIDSNFSKTLRVPDEYVPEMPSLNELEGKILAFSNKKPIGVLPPSGSASDVMLELSKPSGYVAVGTPDGTLQDEALSGAIVSRGRGWFKPKRLFFGADSLTEGTPNSYREVITNLLGAKTAQWGVLVSCRTAFMTNINGFLDGRAVGNRGNYPRLYSLAGDALYGNNLSGATMRHLPLASLGVQLGWKKCRLYYLAQPGGGTFDFRQYSSAGESGEIVSVNTDNATIEIKYAELTVNNSVLQAYVEVLNGTGNLCLFLLQYMSSEDDYYYFQGGQGGSSMQDWNRLDKSTQQQWINHLRFDAYIFNVGTNDRFTRTAEELRADLAEHLTNIASVNNAPQVIVVTPTQTSDFTSTNAKDYPPIYRDVADSNKFGFISMPLFLGDFNTCSSKFGMAADGVHPTKTAHWAFGSYFASLLNLGQSNESAPIYGGAGSGGNADPYIVDFSSWYSNGALISANTNTLFTEFMLGAPYIQLYVDVDVAARVSPGVQYFIEKQIRVFIRSSAGANTVIQSQELLNEVKTEFLNSPWSSLTLTLAADISTGNLRIYGQCNFECNIFIKVTDVRVFLGSTAAKGTALRLVSMIS